MLLQSKIHPDNLKPSTKTVYKASVVDFVKDHIDKNIFVIKAPAGYGKSTVVSDIIDYTRIPYAYYRVDAGDDNLYQIFSYLVGAMRNLLSGFGSEAQNYLDTFRDDFTRNKASKSKVESLVTLFVNELYKIKTNTFIIINDFHFLPPDSIIQDSIFTLLENIPSNIKLIIVTREELKINVAGLVSKRKAVIIGTDLLSFTAEEIMDIGLSLYKKDISKEEAEHLKELTEGWITGIHLYLQSDLSADSVNKLPEEVYSFFAEEVFNELSDEEKKFLLYTSLLENFREEISKHLFKEFDIRHFTDLLLGKNIFLKKITPGNGETGYSYNILFRKFLQDKFTSGIPEEEKSKVFLKLGQYYQGKNEIPDAVDFLLRAGKYDKVILLVKKNIRRLLSEDLILAKKWLSSLPAELKESDKEIVFYSALVSKNLDVDFEEAGLLFRKARSLDPVDEVVDIKCSAYLAEMLSKKERYKEAEELLNKAIKKHKNPFVSLLYFNLGSIFLFSGKYEKCEKSLKKALEVIEEAGKNSELEILKYEIFNSLGGVNLTKGNFTESSYYYEMAVNKMTSHYKQFQVYFNLAYVNILSGNFPKAKEAVDKLETFKTLKELPELKSLYIRSHMLYYFESGNYETSLKFCEALLAHSNALNLFDNKFEALLHYASNYIYLSEPAKAERYIGLAGECLDPSSEIQRAELGLVKSTFEKANGNLNYAEKELLALYDYFKKLQIDTDRTIVSFHLADVYFKKGAKQKAIDFLKLAFYDSVKTGYVNLFRRELLFNKDIFDFAQRNKVNRDFIADIYSYVLLEEFRDLLTDGSKERVTTAIKGLYSVRLYLLGQSKIFVNGIPIEDKKWTRKNFKAIFVYFILNRKNHLTKDFIVDRFLDDVPIEHMDNVFHQLVSCFRAVLKTGGKKDKEDEYLIYKNKILSLNENYHYYSDTEEFLSAFKKLSSEKSPEIARLKSAIDLYKGGFMTENYEEWVEDIRTELDDKYNKLLQKAMEASIAGKDYASIIYFSELLIKNDSLNEKAYKENIKAYVLADNLKIARAKLTSMKSAFMKDLGELPSKKLLSELETLLN